MPRFFATCARGLEPLLARELQALDAAEIEPGRGGVTFSGESELLYLANLRLRTAVRILQPIHEAEVRNPDELYEMARDIDWSEWMSPDGTLAVDSNVRDSSITHSQYAARRIKDAICDQFREKVGRRPSVDTEQPMIGINLHIHRDYAIISLDSSWNSLHKRGYRPIQTRAPLNEALAAGLLEFLGWDGTVPLVDPMCGSGTFLIEGAWIALNRAPGMNRKWFGFMGWSNFDRTIWNVLKEETRRSALSQLPTVIRGGDIRKDAVDFAMTNAKNAGVGSLIGLEKQDLRDARPPAGPPGLVIINPPYGERIGDEDELIPLYRSFGETMALYWKGWRVAVFARDKFLIRKMPLRPIRSTPFFNGSLECRLWEFYVDPVNSGMSAPATERKS